MTISIDKIILSFLFTIISYFILLASSISYGEESINIRSSFRVSPAIIETVLEPNSTVKKVVILSNLTNLPQPIKTLKQGFTPKEKLDLTPEQLNIFDASSWISLSDADTDFILQPLESKTITFNINQPDGATPGGHYATVVFQPMRAQQPVGYESVAIYSRVAVLFFMQTPGNVVQQLEYSNSDIRPVYQSGKLNFDLILKNTGNTHSQPSGRFNVYNDLTGTLATSVIFPSSIILPNTAKSFPIEVELHDFAGKYYVQADLTYGSDSSMLKSSRQGFFLVPNNLACFISLILILIGFIVIRYKSRFALAFKVLFKKGR